MSLGIPSFLLGEWVGFPQLHADFLHIYRNLGVGDVVDCQSCRRFARAEDRGGQPTGASLVPERFNTAPSPKEAMKH
ncbi:MAG: hypothetical protein P0Y64_18125 [Candidatus Sphingomonas colombiensis]|nr:hypothetical protein [Sphingomonas sp.]WEK43215.1 MAG: hypothetical protein P0Y64_18125 [Sphingomonas sp.]